jgi:hypothetical protein
MQAWTVAAAMAAAAFFAIPAAQAQNSPTTPLLSTPGPKDCPPGIKPPPSETTGAGTLSDQLSQSKGVICPPAGVDPGVHVPPVANGRMPVIPPPGTPGGDPNLIPK